MIRRRPKPVRTLSRPDQLAQLICESVNRGNCACKVNLAPSTCDLMIWTAKRAATQVLDWHEQDFPRKDTPHGR